MAYVVARLALLAQTVVSATVALSTDTVVLARPTVELVVLVLSELARALPALVPALARLQSSSSAMTEHAVARLDILARTARSAIAAVSGVTGKSELRLLLRICFMLIPP
jgi:hypothetical protein